METKKIAVASFIGGAICSAVALMFAPAYWWLGLIAGISAGLVSGYISYDFRDVLRKIPIALRAAGKGVAIAITEVIDTVTDAAHEIKEWSKKPHPFVYSSLAITIVFFVWLEFSYFHVMAEAIDPTTGVKWGILDSQIFFFTISMGLLVVWSFFLLPLFVSIGTRSEHCYWETNPYGSLFSGIDKLKNEDDKSAPLTYANVARWFAKGLGITVLFFIWTMWWKSLIGIVYALWFTILFVGHLVKLTYSKPRVLCAVNGTLGGVASFVWFASSATSFAEQVVLVIFGGLLGVAFGVANWEIVSKRIFHVKVPVRSIST